MKSALIKLSLLIITIGVILFLSFKIKNLNNNLNISKSNEKAYATENLELRNKSNSFQLTITQLSYYQDSLNQEMLKVKDSLKIKDKNLKHMAYILSKVSKIDTIIFKDTIFQKDINIDTTIGDKWYILNLKLKYPNKVETKPTFISEKYIITSYKKETINPPKKLCILRWFQKKHKIIEVEVIEKNPYIKGEKQRFIEVIK